MKPCKHPCCPDSGCRRPIQKKNRTPLKRSKKRINPYSKKRVKINRVYSALRKLFLYEHPECRANLPGCSFNATEVHHKVGRIGENLTDTDNWLPVCRSCHDRIEKNPLEAKEKDLSRSRLVQNKS